MLLTLSTALFMTLAGFTYHPETGKCIDSQGQEGLNPIDQETLFVRDEEGARIISNKNAECVDFRNFDFYKVIQYDYTTLKYWNLRGADLTGSRLFFANLIDADFSGAKLQGLQSGYAYISGSIDAHTQGRPRYLTDFFRYNTQTGLCLNSRSEVGLNQVNIKSVLEDALQENNSYPWVNLQCVDLKNIYFEAFIGFGYPKLTNWDLRGANLDGASLHFADLINVRLHGAQMKNLSIGYTSISGVGDQFTRLMKSCDLTPNYEVNCEQ